MMDKQKFLEVCGRIFDEVNQPRLFGEQEPAPETPKAERKKHVPFRSYKPSSRLDNVSQHYEVTTDVIRGVCDDLGIVPFKDKSNRERISKEDVVLLTKVITKKYDEFNNWSLYE